MLYHVTYRWGCFAYLITFALFYGTTSYHEWFYRSVPLCLTFKFSFSVLGLSKQAKAYFKFCTPYLIKIFPRRYWIGFDLNHMLWVGIVHYGLWLVPMANDIGQWLWCDVRGIACSICQFYDIMGDVKRYSYHTSMFDVSHSTLRVTVNSIQGWVPFIWIHKLADVCIGSPFITVIIPYNCTYVTPPFPYIHDLGTWNIDTTSESDYTAY